MNVNTASLTRPHGNTAAHYHKAEPKTDMTPLVDLGFLLISFFVITTEMSKPTVTISSCPGWMVRLLHWQNPRPSLFYLMTTMLFIIITAIGSRPLQTMK